MRDALQAGADRLRLQAIIFSALSVLAASALPVVTYVFVFQYAPATSLGPFAWALWATAGAACGLGIMAHAAGSRALLAMHAAFGGMLGAALGGFYTAFWFVLDTRCGTVQAAFQGCAGCPCAATSTCTAAQLGAASCASCTAYPTEVCDPLRQTQQKFVLAFTGLAAVVFLALPVLYSLLALGRLEASGAAAAAKRQMVAFSVEQQAGLVAAGDKPTVTPDQLGAWVAFLLDCGDRECTAAADRCRAALAARGFDLPLPSKPKKSGQPPSKKGLLRGKSRKDKEVAMTASSSGLPPAAQALAAAEAGQGPRPGGGRRSGMIAAEQSGQFVTGQH